MSKVLLLMVVAALVFFAFLRADFGGSEPEAAAVERKAEKPSDASTGAAPSPGNDPNMHNSPTRRLGF
jgi:hypothetical protein